MNTPKENSQRDNAGRAAREAVSLKEHFSKRLRAYVVTAGAAGAGMLAVARPAAADIIFTPVNIAIEPNSSILLDLNHDTTNDFTLFHFENSLADGTMSMKGLQEGNAAVGHTTSQFGFRHAVASRLASGARIGWGEPFRRSAVLGEVLCCFSSRYYGPWVFGGDGFLGLRFEIDGQTHYGWAELAVVFDQSGLPRYTETLEGYAYDTVANDAILAGQGSLAAEPGTLGLLALGSLGLGFLRRRSERHTDLPLKVRDS
jgi:hypothetical protein